MQPSSKLFSIHFPFKASNITSNVLKFNAQCIHPHRVHLSPSSTLHFPPEKKWCKNNDVEVSINVFSNSSLSVSCCFSFFLRERESHVSTFSRQTDEGEREKKNWRSSRKIFTERKLEKLQQQKIKEFSLLSLSRPQTVVELSQPTEA